jgi:phytoene dehydrogenase-like protein
MSADSTPPKSAVRAAYDAVIIGAGFSGLAAALRLARFGKKVAVLESHTIPGGLNSYYFRPPKASIFNAGLHTLTNFRADDPRWGRGYLCRALAIGADEFKLHPPKHPAAVVTPRLRFEFSGGYENFQSALFAKFPQAAGAWPKFEESLRSATGRADAITASADEVVDAHFADADLQEILRLPVYLYGGYREGALDWRTFAVIFRSLIIDGFGSPVNMKAVLDCLVGHLKSAGGEIHLRTPVRRIVTRDGAACGVVTARGDEIACTKIISSAGLAETLALTDTPVLAESAPGVSAFETTLEFTAPLETLGVARSLVFVSKQERFQWVLPDRWDEFFHATLSVADSYVGLEHTAPHHLKIGTYMRGTGWFGLEQPIYEERKAVMQEKLLAEIKNLFPALDIKQARRIESMTPRTVHQYTGHYAGAIYGASAKLFAGRTDMGNLFICGNDQGGIGVMGACISGVVVANVTLLPGG